MACFGEEGDSLSPLNSTGMAIAKHSSAVQSYA